MGPRTVSVGSDTGQPIVARRYALRAVDVRIGVTQAPRELNVEMPDDGARRTSKPGRGRARRRHRRAVAHRQARQRRRHPGGEDRLRRARHRPTATGASASGADRPASRVPGDLLDRHLLFVTGKGGVGKTSVAAALADLARPRTASARWSARWTPRARSPPTFDTTPLDVRAARRSTPNLFAMAMNTEDSLREYLRLFVKVPLVGRIGPLARTFDFVADAAPGRQGDPRRRQAGLRGARAPLRPRGRRRRGQRAHRRPDRRAAGDPRAGPGRAWSATRRGG